MTWIATQCEVKWALGSITVNKASGGDGIPIELFQILKDDTVKVLHSMLLLSRFSRVQLCATPQMAAHQAPPSMGFSRQEYWSEVPLPSPAAFNRPANLEKSAVATGLEKGSFHSNLKDRECQRKLKPLYNCTHFTCQQDYIQNSSSQVPTVHELGNSRYTSWIQKRKRNQNSNCQYLLDYRKGKGIPEKHMFSASLAVLQPLTMLITRNWNILKEMGIPDHLTCLLRNLYAGQEAIVGTRLGTTDWFKRSTSRLYTVTMLI